MKLFKINKWINAKVLVISTMVLVCLGLGLAFRQGIVLESDQILGSLDLSGPWEFHNGPIGPSDNFKEKVTVPNPLPEHIRSNLAEEFWYRKKFEMPKKYMGQDLAFSLGSVKGKSEVYWNDQFIGGSNDGLHVFNLPPSLTNKSSVELKVRVLKSKALFPGIVHFTQMPLSFSGDLNRLVTQYYFSVGLKPFVPAALKLAFFFLFSLLYLATPIRREYASFAIFFLLSSCHAILWSKFLPIYEEYDLRRAGQFLFSTISLACIPWLSSDFLRFSNKNRSIARCYGAVVATTFLLAACITSNKQALYQVSSAYLPLLLAGPWLFISFAILPKLDASLKHRKIQVVVFGLFIGVGALSWTSLSGGWFQFKLWVFPELLDIIVAFGLAVCAGLEQRSSANRLERSDRLMPKWLKPFMASKVENVKIEIPMVVLKVDTVSYTKKLAALGEAESEVLHTSIREVLEKVRLEFGAERLSDGGDGAFYGWELSNHAATSVIKACDFLRSHPSLQFRMGLAAGPVRCELRRGDYSFLGECLNTAARLEAIASPGLPLVDESMVRHVAEENLDKSWIEQELKGQLFRARPLLKSVA